MALRQCPALTGEYPSVAGAGESNLVILGPETSDWVLLPGDAIWLTQSEVQVPPAQALLVISEPEPEGLVAVAYHVVDKPEGLLGRVQAVAYGADKQRVLIRGAWDLDLSDDWTSLFLEDPQNPASGDKPVFGNILTMLKYGGYPAQKYQATVLGTPREVTLLP